MARYQPWLPPSSAEIRRGKHHDQSAPLGLDQREFGVREVALVRCGEVIRLEERRLAVGVVGRMIGELVFDEIDDDGVEAALRTIIEIAR